jgi:alanine-glyoxylate transaminase/serine-glyoxylate transaminase/serine-pyruvate transaminase
VLAALARPTVGHLDPYYLQIMDELQAMLRDVFRTKNRMTIAISGTGSAGQEATVLNLVEPGERVLVCINGVFGGRLADMAERAGGEVSKIERPWGEVFTVSEVKDALARVKPTVVAIVMAETSTGAWQPIEEIAAAVREAGAMLILDTVTALGGIPVEIDKWQVDAVYSGTQKCLSCPPGLAPVSFSDRAVEKILKRREKVRSWYLDVSLIANYWGGDRVYHHTAPINMTYALHEALRLVLEEGLENCIRRHRRNHDALQAGLAAVGIEYATQAGHALPQLNAVRIPSGVDDGAVRKALLERFGIEIGAGLGAFKGKVWRIGLMGYGSRQTNVLCLLAALEQLLAAQGHRFERGASIAAANVVYGS